MISKHIVEAFVQDFFGPFLFFLISSLIFAPLFFFFNIDKMHLEQREKHTQTEELEAVTPKYEGPAKDGYNGRGVGSLEDNTIRGEMSVSSVETICSYSSGGASLGAAKETHVTSETGPNDVTNIANTTNRADVTKLADTTKRADVVARPRERGSTPTPDESAHTKQTALSCALGRISSNYVMHTSNNTSSAGEWSRKLSTSNTVNLCKVTKFMTLCDEHLPASAACIGNGTNGAKKVEWMPQKNILPLKSCQLYSHQVNVTQTERSCESDHKQDAETKTDPNRSDHNDKHSNSCKANNQLEREEDPSYDHPSNNKRVFIQGIKRNYHTKGGNTFTYLNQVLDKTYKETVELDGSEYIFLYDIICVQDGDIASQVDGTGGSTHSASFGASTAVRTTPLEEENEVLTLNAYNKYVNFFHNLSNQLNRIRRLIYPIEVDMSTGYACSGSLAIAHNNADTKRNDARQEQMGRCRMVGGFDETNLESIQTLFSEEAHMTGSLKMKLLDRINGIFFTAMGAIGKEVNSTAGEKYAKTVANPVGESIPSMASHLHVSCPPRKNQLTPLDVNKVMQHMKGSANRRIHESDIYDIKIVKKGYFYLYVRNGQWDNYYCVLFHLKNNVLFKNDILYSHYCRVYDRGVLHNVLNSPDSYSNYFMAFFKDHRFDMSKLSNLELAIMVRKNYYPFVIELSRSKKASILIHTDQDLLLHGEHMQAQRVRSSLLLFDIHSDPFYLVPVECLPDIGGAKITRGAANEPPQGGIPPRVKVKLHYGLLKEWNDCLDSVLEEAKQKQTNLSDKRGQSEKTHYVNKKFSQWIEAFKKERNIQDGGAPQRR